MKFQLAQTILNTARVQKNYQKWPFLEVFSTFDVRTSNIFDFKYFFLNIQAKIHKIQSNDDDDDDDACTPLI